MLHTYIHTYRQTYRASDEAGPSGAFAPKNMISLVLIGGFVEMDRAKTVTAPYSFEGQGVI